MMEREKLLILEDIIKNKNLIVRGTSSPLEVIDGIEEIRLRRLIIFYILAS